MKALLDFYEVKDDMHFFFYKHMPKEEQNISFTSSNEKINQISSDELTEKIWKEYEKSLEEFTDDLTLPDKKSFYKALRFIKEINGHRAFIKSVCALGSGGFSFRFQKQETEYIDIDIYNGDDTIVFLHSKKGQEAKAFDLSFSETITMLKGALKHW